MQITGIRNYWNVHCEKMDIESQMILRETLPTPAFRMLLNIELNDLNVQLGALDTSCTPEEFKLKYLMLKKRKSVLEDFLHFLKTLTDKGTGS